MRILRSRRSGQSAVMVSLLTMIVVMMIAFTTNLGKLVTERIAIQNTADLAAYSAAATQAGELNRMRRINQDIWKLHNDARKRLERTERMPEFGLGTPCTIYCGPGGPIIGAHKCMMPLTNPGAITLIQQTKAQVESKSAQLRGLNENMGSKARGAAESSVEQNYPGAQLTPKGGSLQKADIQQTDLDLDYYGWGAIAFPSYCPFNGQPVGSNIINHDTAKSWYYKNPNANGEVMFAVEVGGTPANAFLGTTSGTYLGNYFGDRRPLKAYAAALPIAGKLGTIKGGSFALTNEPEIMFNGFTNQNINDLIPIGPGHASSTQSIASSEPVQNNGAGGYYRDYRARYVGIFESRAQFPDGSTLKNAFGGDGDKIAH